jgi:hypothetical protein
MLEIINMATERSVQFMSNQSTSLLLDVMYRNGSINYIITNLYFMALSMHRHVLRETRLQNLFPEPLLLAVNVHNMSVP